VVIAAYLEHAWAYDVDLDGKATVERTNIALSLQPLRFFYADEPVESFGPLKL
jgi:hypothetical protein